jgi:hypothetical protein
VDCLIENNLWKFCRIRFLVKDMAAVCNNQQTMMLVPANKKAARIFYPRRLIGIFRVDCKVVFWCYLRLGTATFFALYRATVAAVALKVLVWSEDLAVSCAG